jgi:predicted lipid-binding transport protein (Tim44 family)
MKFPRWFALLAALVVLAPVLAPSLAEARAGAGGGAGSRGSRTNQAPPPTRTAPTARPIERSTPSQQQVQRPGAGLSSPAAAGSMFSRHPFLSGVMGGLLGAGLFGMLLGGGFAGGMAGMAGLLGLLLQLALLGGLAFLGLRLWRSRMAGRGAPGGPAYAYSGGLPSARPMARSAATLAGAGGASADGAPLAILPGDYHAFEARLGEVQAAYSAGDVGRLRQLATPEMADHLAEELAANTRRGVVNKVESVKLEQGDLAEAWREGNTEYATVAMHFSLLDYARSLADGRVVAGSDRLRTEATEIWTFCRERGGAWVLSAIQQA